MDLQKIAHAADLLGLALDPATDLTVSGDDPIFKTRMHLGEGIATVVALLGQEANRIWMLRGGSAQTLSLDARHAAASMRSYTLLRHNGERANAKRVMSNITAFWPCRNDRFIYLHESFSDPPGILAELGLSPTGASKEDIAAATRQRDAFELEDALAAKGLCGVVCRSVEEWATHPQGQLLAGLPVVEITRIGDAPPQPFAPGVRPLSGVRVLDLTRVLAGPVCGRTLAEHGADVLHIASPHLPTFEAFEMDTGHGKRQAFVDLNRAADVETLRALARDADVFSQGFRFGSLARRGFGAEDLAAIRPGIIYVSENAFGHEGPWRARPGWEQMAQTVTGSAALDGTSRPRLAPAAINDYTTGYLAALGTMIALRRRAVEGGSWQVRVSLAQTNMWYLRLGLDLDPRAGSSLADAPSYMSERDTPYGRIDHVTPPLRMSQTMPRWELPTAPIGSGKPVWHQSTMPKSAKRFSEIHHAQT